MGKLGTACFGFPHYILQGSSFCGATGRKSVLAGSTAGKRLGRGAGSVLFGPLAMQLYPTFDPANLYSYNQWPAGRRHERMRAACFSKERTSSPKVNY